MTNEEKSQEISEKYKHYNVECSSLDCYLSALEMAKWKDSQPQIIEIFGKRVKMVNDGNDAYFCEECALFEECSKCATKYHVCAKCVTFINGVKTYIENRHFVEVDEDGNEIK